MKKNYKYIVVIRKFPGWMATEIPCFIGQRVYRCRWVARLVYKYWRAWSYNHAYKKEPVSLGNIYPIAISFGIVFKDGSVEITER